jgi:hypothetical protein
MRVLTAVVMVAATGCSLFKVNAPPDVPYKPVSEFECTASSVLPLVDVAIAATLAVAGVGATLNADREKQVIAVPIFLLAGGEAGLSVWGFTKTARCREALAAKDAADMAATGLTLEQLQHQRALNKDKAELRIVNTLGEALISLTLTIPETREERPLFVDSRMDTGSPTIEIAGLDGQPITVQTSVVRLGNRDTQPPMQLTFKEGKTLVIFIDFDPALGVHRATPHWE